MKQFSACFIKSAHFSRLHISVRATHVRIYLRAAFWSILWPMPSIIFVCCPVSVVQTETAVGTVYQKRPWRAKSDLEERLCMWSTSSFRNMNFEWFKWNLNLAGFPGKFTRSRSIKCSVQNRNKWTKCHIQIVFPLFCFQNVEIIGFQIIPSSISIPSMRIRRIRVACAKHHDSSIFHSTFIYHKHHHSTANCNTATSGIKLLSVW